MMWGWRTFVHRRFLSEFTQLNPCLPNLSIKQRLLLTDLKQVSLQFVGSVYLIKLITEWKAFGGTQGALARSTARTGL